MRKVISALVAVSLGVMTPWLCAAPASEEAKARAVRIEEARMFALTPKQFCGVELRKAKGKNVRGDYVWWNALTAVLGRYEITLAQLEAIRQGQVSVGMPACAALAAWGKPTRLSKTSNALGTHQLWAYDHGYLYFDDNETLVSIERH